MNDSTETAETVETMEKTTPGKTETKTTERKAAETTQSKSDETSPKPSKSANSQVPSISFRCGKALKESYNFLVVALTKDVRTINVTSAQKLMHKNKTC